MGLLERDYARKGYESRRSKNDSEIITQVKETYKLFGASLLAGSIGSYLAMPYAATISEYLLPFVLLQLAVLFALFLLKNTPGLNITMLFLFTLLTGVSSVPILSTVLSIEGGISIIGNSFLMTSVIMGIMSYTAIKTTKDFTNMTKPLLIALVVIIVFSLINIFFLQSSVFSMIISGVSTFLFSIFILIDTQNIIKGNYTPIEGAINLYLDFLNIFLNLLNLFVGFSRED